MKKLLAIIVFLLLASVVAGHNYQNGYTEDGYSYYNGYWYLGDVPYTRQQESYYYQYSGYGPYYQAYRYRYYRYYPPTPPVPPKLPVPGEPEWKAKLLDVAGTLAGIEAKKQLAAIDNAAYMEAIRELGLKANFGYGPAPNAVPNVQLGTYGASGNTLYGYNYQFSTIQDLFGDTSIMGLQYAQAVQAQQAYADKAVSGLGALADKQGSYVARAAEILARGEAARNALLGAQGNGSRTEQHISINGSSPQPQPAVQPLKQIPGQADYGAQNATLQQSCVKCHSGAEPKGRLDLTDYGILTDEQKESVFERLTTRDEKLRMPPGSSPLPKAKTKLFFN